jgi:hypothetical protein
MKGIKTRQLFPFLKRNGNVPTEGAIKWPYATWHKKLKYLISNHCGTKKRIDTSETRVGTHTLYGKLGIFSRFGAR